MPIDIRGVCNYLRLSYAAYVNIGGDLWKCRGVSSMANPYREIFRAPGAKGFAAAGFVARLPMAMAPIGIVAMLSQTHGEYWLAGAVSATYALTNALRRAADLAAVDRLGQTPGRRADHHRLGARLRGADRGRQPGLADLDAVRCRRCSPPPCPAFRRWCGRAGPRFSATGRSSTRPSPSNRRRTSWSISPAPRCRWA